MDPDLPVEPDHPTGSQDAPARTPRTSRRRFLTTLAATGAGAAVVSGAAACSGASAQADDAGAGEASAPLKAPPPPGAPGARVAMLVYPGMILQDLVGPLTVLNVARAEIILVAATRDPVATDVKVPVAPTATFADCPPDLDVLFVPGGLEGTAKALGDRPTLDFLADRGARATWVTGVCTGTLLLGGAGLLRGYRATSHWYVRDQLSLLGATPVDERVVRDRNRLTGGGVTSGLDFALTLVALLSGDEEAKRVQLLLEYAPKPPFDAGTPATAPKGLVDEVLRSRAPAIASTRALATEIGKTFPA